MSNRFFVNSSITSDEVLLTGDEAHHLARVMRCEAGTCVVLFDGSGAEFSCRVQQVGKSNVTLRVLERCEVDRELPHELTLGVALPKGDRQRWLTEKAVELGVTRLVPLRTSRGVAQPVDKTVVRLQRTVVEASKQCGRNRLMEVSSAMALSDFLEAAPIDALRLIAHPGGEASPPLPEGPVFLAIGPEGGFTDLETENASALGWLSVDLGPRILRVETCALALVASMTCRDHK